MLLSDFQGHLKQGDEKREIGRLPRHRRRKNAPEVSQREPKGSRREAKIRPRAACGPPQGRVELRSVCGLPFQHAPFPRSRSGFCSILFFSRRIPSWIPPFPSLVGRFLVTFCDLLVEIGLSCFRYVFFECFWTIFDVFLTSSLC